MRNFFRKFWNGFYVTLMVFFFTVVAVLIVIGAAFVFSLANEIIPIDHNGLRLLLSTCISVLYIAIVFGILAAFSD
jgi:uncharacterized membrane protein